MIFSALYSNHSMTSSTRPNKHLCTFNRLFLFALVLTAGLTISQIGMAADPTTAPSPTSTPKSSAHNGFVGTVTAVTSTSLTVTKKKTGESHTVQLSSDTKVFFPHHVEGAVSDLAIGQHVAVRTTPDKLKALRILIHKPKDAKGTNAPCHCANCEDNTKCHEATVHSSSSPSPEAAPVTK